MFEEVKKRLISFIQTLGIIAVILIICYFVFIKTSTIYIDAKTNDCYITNNIISEIVTLPVKMTSKQVDAKGNVIEKEKKKINLASQ